MISKTTLRLAAGSAAFLGLALGMPIGAAISHADPAPVVIEHPQEDEPGWDAERDGNGIVGPDWDCATMGDLICQHLGTGAQPGPR